MPETINPTFHRTPADVIACPDPTCRRLPGASTAGPGDPATGPSSTSRPAVSAATGSRRRSTRSISSRFPPGPARRWRPSP